MKAVDVPPYDILSYPIKPAVGGNHFGAKPIVSSRYQIQPSDTWKKEFWGKTEDEAIANARRAIDKWLESAT